MLDALGGTPWGYGEWLYMGGLSKNISVYEQWLTAVTNSLGYRNNRFLSLYNYNSLDNDSFAAIATALNADAGCVVDVTFDQV